MRKIQHYTLRAFFLPIVLTAVLFSPSVQAEQFSVSGVSSAAKAWTSSISRIAEIAMYAMSVVDVRYRYGGNSPETGLDCSGLVKYVFKEVLNVDLPRTAAGLSKVGEGVDVEDLQPGDLVFYNTRRRKFSHVGIYLGDDKFIHAPSRGNFVRVENMRTAYWDSRFNGARRLPAVADLIEGDEGDEDEQVAASISPGVVEQQIALQDGE
jgi:cell wall-associated NlpC family hydrolase